jgi:RNA polymerase sigma-70 factor (ECF subfamily)
MATAKCTRSPRRPAANGNRPLGPALGAREHSYVFSVAMKYVKDEESAADVAQEALLLAHRHRDAFRGQSLYSTWLYRIAATAALMHLRKRRRQAREVAVTELQDGERVTSWELARATTADPQQVTLAREALARAQREVSELGDKYAEVFRLRFAEGYTEAEIAEALALPLTTVKTRAFRARRAALRALGEPPSALAAAS